MGTGRIVRLWGHDGEYYVRAYRGYAAPVSTEAFPSASAEEYLHQGSRRERRGREQVDRPATQIRDGGGVGDPGRQSSDVPAVFLPASALRTQDQIPDRVPVGFRFW